MNEKINQILKNQEVIMAVLRIVAKDKPGYLGSLNKNREITKEFLKEENSEVQNE